jgi:hypothetical protein
MVLLIDDNCVLVTYDLNLDSFSLQRMKPGILESNSLLRIWGSYGNKRTFPFFPFSLQRYHLR